MKYNITKRQLPVFIIVLLGLLGTQCKENSKKKASAPVNETAIEVPEGFSVSVVAKDLGNLRHMSVSKTGDIYINRSKLKDEKGLVWLQDKNQDGSIDEQKFFGPHPGTGVLVHNGYLYTSSNSAIYRYPLNDKDEVIDIDKPELIVEGLADKGRDNAKSFVMDKDNNIYVTIGSWSDTCRQDDSGEGMMPCTILDSAGGIWQYKANKLNQSFADGKRYATGVKNAVATAWNHKTNSLFAAVHGRGAFHDAFPEFFTAKQSAELPAETLYEIKDGDDAGWPYIYYDQFKNQKMLAPEYGGDGEITAGEEAIDPLMAFPAHLAPNDLLFYTGTMFPEKYRNSAFIAFHGQSPELKKGYFVAFVPFKDGKPTGAWEIFADNFSGIDLANPSGPIKYRPCGLAQGPDGALYVCEDLNGTVFKITY